MQTIKIELELPGEIVTYLNPYERDFQRKAREIVLYQLIQENKISFGKAAEILGMSKLDYITDLGKMGIPYFDGNLDEISNDIANIKQLMRDSEK